MNAVCSNTQGSHNCTCKPGYSGDGKKCIAVGMQPPYRIPMILSTIILCCLVRKVVQFTNILPKYLTISRRRRREYRQIVTSTIFTSREEANCFSIITLMIIRENKIKNRQMFERFWGFKMSVEGGSDRQQAGFLIIAAVGFPHGNVKFCQTFI